MNSVVLQFPSIRVERAEADSAWMVLTHRGHGWLHNAFDDAVDDARVIAAGFGLAAVSSAGWIRP